MDTRNDLVAAARGDRLPDILIKHVRLFNVLTLTKEFVDIGIVGERIAFVLPAGTASEGMLVIDGEGLSAVPGFVDGHVHNESSQVTPAQWAKAILPLGTTCVFTDPHEIGNVLGLPGIQYMIEASRGLPLRYFITAPSCVPAVPGLETAGAVITDLEMRQILTWERVKAVAEAMDYMGLILQKGNITPIAEVAHAMGVGIESHAPGVIGRYLQAYLAATGPSAADHEAMSGQEMLEKVALGMMIYCRASTFHDGTPNFAQAFKQVRDTRMFGFCTDDVMPHHLLQYGHLNFGIRRLIENGVEPIVAYQMATLNVASHYRLQGVGAIAPGWYADIVLLDNPATVSVQHVISNGVLVVRDRTLIIDIEEPIPPLLENTVLIPNLTEADFILSGNADETTFNGIHMSTIFTEPARITLPVREGKIILPLPEGVTIAAIVPRHGQNRPPSLAPMTGYQLKQGAVASTVSHDSHNMAVIGKDPHDMLIAALELRRVGGGLTAVLDGHVLATIELPVAGLMSMLTVEEVAAEDLRLESVLPQLGLPSEFPIHLLALALPVVPKVRLTDLGLVDVASQAFIPLICNSI